MTNLATNFAIIILLIGSSCSAQNEKQSDGKCLEEIVSMEIKRHFVSKELTSEKNIYFWFSLNDVLTGFLKEKTKTKYHPANNTGLSETEWKMLFNKKEVSFLLNQLSNEDFDLAHIKFPEKFTLSDPKKEEKHINGNGLLSAEYLSKKRFFLSIPIILSNNQYALIAYSSGTINSTQGGIHLYKKINGNWIFYKRLSGWIS